MKKFWYELNEIFFRLSMAASLILVFIVSIISFTRIDEDGMGAFLIGILILIFGSLCVVAIHSVWGLIIEFVGTVYIIRDDLQTIKDSSEKNEDTNSKTREVNTQPLKGAKRCSCGAPLKENDIVCLRCGKTVESLLKDTVQEKKIPTSTSTWKCLKCNSVNPDTDGECRVCKRPRWTKEPQKWVCTHCSNVNSGNENYCGVCGSHRGNAQTQPMPSVSAPPKAVVAVSSPSAPAPTAVPKPQPAPQKWTCSNCGNVNNPNANFCSICGNHK